jgi:hypothetical protein
MMRTYFDEAIGTVPPAQVDVDDVIRRGRRRSRRRTGIAGAATVVVLAAAGLVGTGLRPIWGTDSGAGAPSTSTEQRLTRALEAAVAAHAPGKVSDADNGLRPLQVAHLSHERYRGLFPRPVVAVKSAPNVYAAAATLTIGVRTGVFVIFIGRADALFVPPKCQAEVGDKYSCTIATGPQGALIVRREWTYGEDKGVHRQSTVQIDKTDGTRLVLSANNLVLDPGQLIAIGTERALTMTP